MHQTDHPSLPKLEMNQGDLRILVVETISPLGDSFQYSELLDAVASAVGNSGKNLQKEIADDNFKLNKTDCSRIREIVWDFIILRYITIGDDLNDTWPYLSLTEQGKAYFHTKELSEEPYD